MKPEHNQSNSLYALFERERADIEARPKWLSELRERSADQIKNLGVPGRKSEAWRYTSLEFLDDHEYQAANTDVGSELQLEDIKSLLLDEGGKQRLVFVNGIYMPDLSCLDGLSKFVVAGSLRQGCESGVNRIKSYLQKASDEADVFVSLNNLLMKDGGCLYIAPGAHIHEPIELLHIAMGMHGVSSLVNPRHMVILGEGAEAHLIERYAGIDGHDSFTNSLVDIWLGQEAVLTHERVQEEHPQARHLCNLNIHQDKASSYRQRSAMMGGTWSRTGIKLEFTGEDAEADIDALFLVADRQLNDMHLDIRHRVPNCRSRENVKGILLGKGRGVFDGRVLVDKDAQKTDAKLSNHNLILSSNAEIDTKPQLEIYADDVKCSHGTTVGELDEDMLFYLRSRGIGRHEAIQMLCMGFANEVLDQYENEAVRHRVIGQLENLLLTEREPA